MEDSNMKNCRNSLITFMLNNAASKYPIKASDLNQIIHSDQKMLNTCFASACEALKNTFGIGIYPVPDSAVKKYICVSEIPVISTKEYDNNQKIQLVLLFLILSYIFMTKTPVTEERLEKYLKSIHVDINEDHHYFGNTKKIITDTFIKQLYLKKEKVTDELQSQTQFVYSWGFRSIKEFSKMDVLKATAEILGKSPEIYVKQFEEANQEQRI